jgi:hypothetical protein
MLMLKWTDKEIYIEEECSRRTARLICNHELAGAVRKQTERTVQGFPTQWRENNIADKKFHVF